jgi:Patatin-like phospholipase
MEKYQPTFSSVIEEEEIQWIKTRREIGKISSNQNTDNLTGIALSGGGIRSATFNLGVLQAFENAKSLKNIDYMSSVSGGGYIASTLTWFKSKQPEHFPFGSKRSDHNQLGGQVVSWIRSHCSFLTPGNGISMTSLLSAIFTGTVINLLIIIPIFMLVMFGLSESFDVPLINQTSTLNGFDLLMSSAKWLFCLGFILMILTALSTSIDTAKRGKLTEHLRRSVSMSFSLAIIFLAIAVIPMIHTVVDKLTDMLIHASFSLSVLGVIISWFSASKAKSTQLSLAPIFVTFGLLISCLGIVMLSYHLVSLQQFNITYFSVSLILSFILAIGCNINLVSMHGYYRNRLRDTFMPFQLPVDASNQHRTISTWQEAQSCYLKDIPVTDAPFHIVNCNIELTTSKQSKYRNRAGDSFTFSPLYSGASSTGYEATQIYLDGKVDLASVTAISGAAVATNTSATKSRPVNFLMAMLNLRLGCWLKNPREKNTKQLNRPLWYSAMFNDMFGRKLDEHQTFVHLSDGGHFENLGVYELVRRKVKMIFSFDVGADPQYKFQDLGKLIELIRVDFGAKLTIDIEAIRPNSEGLSTQSWAIGEIIYSDKTKATFVYIKSSICHPDKLSEDINSYKRENPDFPHQSTANQFFNEAQFEAYRELGFQITHQLLKQESSLLDNTNLATNNNKKECHD